MILMFVWFLVAMVFRCRFEFSIRSLLVLTVVVALPCSWLSVKMRAAKEQHLAFEKIAKEKTFGDGLTVYDYDGGPSEAEWLLDLFGIDFFHDVAEVGLHSDSQMEFLACMPQIREMAIDGTEITDAGMEHMKGLKQLQMLWVRDTAVTDTGLSARRRDLSP